MHSSQMNGSPPDALSSNGSVEWQFAICTVLAKVSQMNSHYQMSYLIEETQKRKLGPSMCATRCSLQLSEQDVISQIEISDYITWIGYAGTLRLTVFPQPSILSTMTW